jgi:hypothetical protein
MVENVLPVYLVVEKKETVVRLFLRFLVRLSLNKPHEQFLSSRKVLAIRMAGPYDFKLHTSRLRSISTAESSRFRVNGPTVFAEVCHTDLPCPDHSSLFSSSQPHRVARLGYL